MKKYRFLLLSLGALLCLSACGKEAPPPGVVNPVKENVGLTVLVAEVDEALLQ